MKPPALFVSRETNVITVTQRFNLPVDSVVSFAAVSSQKLKDVESIVKIVELNGEDLVRDYSDEIERMLGSKMKSVKVRKQVPKPELCSVSSCISCCGQRETLTSL